MAEHVVVEELRKGSVKALPTDGALLKVALDVLLKIPRAQILRKNLLTHRALAQGGLGERNKGEKFNRKGKKRGKNLI